MDDVSDVACLIERVVESAVDPLSMVVIGHDAVMLAGAADGVEDDPVRMIAMVHGSVQGVGFRWWTRARAAELELVGSAVNKADGRVEVVAEGSRLACGRLLAALRGPHAPGRVALVVERFEPAGGGLAGFSVG